MKNYIVIDRNVFGYLRIKGYIRGMESETPYMCFGGYTEKDAIAKWRRTYNAMRKHLTIIRIY